MALSRGTMQRIYLGLAAVGYVAAGVPMLMESARSGNLLFWTQPSRTVSELFANLTSTAFANDLIVGGIVAMVWMAREGRRLGMRRRWLYPTLTLLFGIAGTLPLFLALREARLDDR